MNSSDSSLLAETSKNKQLANDALKIRVNHLPDHDIGNESNNDKNKNSPNNTASNNIGKIAN